MEGDDGGTRSAARREKNGTIIGKPVRRPCCRSEKRRQENGGRKQVAATVFYVPEAGEQKSVGFLLRHVPVRTIRVRVLLSSGSP